MPPVKLTPHQLRLELADLNAVEACWEILDGKLHAEFRFPDFVRAFGFMTECALIAESMGHHPEWFNVYGKVIVDLITHDAGGISALDFKLASQMQQIARRTPS